MTKSYICVALLVYRRYNLIINGNNPILFRGDFMLHTYTCAFFGHRDFCFNYKNEAALDNILRQLIKNNEYLEFLVGRNGEFDRFAASRIVHAKKQYGNFNSSLTLVLPYHSAEFYNNEKYFLDYYDEVEICEQSSIAHYKSAMKIRNQNMVERADLIICYIERNTGGAYKAVQYANLLQKPIINLAEINSDN